MESAQANVFVWASAGQVRIGDGGGLETAGNVGGQIDYETRCIYAELHTDYTESRSFRHRIDTVQLGFAPYEHDYGRLARAESKRRCARIPRPRTWSSVSSAS